MKYVQFMKAPSASGKTSVYRVLSMHDVLIGTIKWYGPWRQYVFEAEPNVVWSYGCLNDVISAVIKANDEQRQKHKEKS